VSFTKHSDYVLAWYESIFEESVGKSNVEQLDEVKDDIVKNRVLMKFTQEGVTVEQILAGLKAMVKDGGFDAKTIIVDGFDFVQADGERFAKIKAFAESLGLSFWYSCSSDRYDKQGVPEDIAAYAQAWNVIIKLEPRPDHIELSVVKDRETWNPKNPGLKLDPKTLLMLA
jgi:hypothetical protein